MDRKDWDEALLVAYVDGELDVDARERVQRILATDPEAAAIVERLEASADACRDAFSTILREPVPGSVLQSIRSMEAGRAGPRTARRHLFSWTYSGWWRIGAVPLSAACGALLAMAVLNGAPSDAGVRLAAGPEDPLAPEAVAALADILEQGGSQAEGERADGVPWRLDVAPSDPRVGGCRPLLYNEADSGRIAGIACPSGDGLWSVSTIGLDRTRP